ncbi:MAG: hypothetical protein JOZ19_07115, partial [Rubrobacter sp.]|nr:hypothetical protein [Rubrobacter sp.]
MRIPSTSLEEDPGFGVKRAHFGLIQWLAVLTPALVVGLLEFLRHQWLEMFLPTWLSEGWFGNLVGAAAVAVVVYVFVRSFTVILQQSASEVTQVREEAATIVERQRIAREMHDSVAQTLFYLMVKLREVDDLVLTDESKQAYDELQTMREETKAAHHQVKAVIEDLRQQAELQDLGEAIRRTAIGLAEHLEMQVNCEVVGRINLPTSSREHVLAIVQEALTNAS